MNTAPLEYPRPAELLAKSLLSVWLSGDHRRLRMELESLSLVPLPPETSHEFERIDLLKCVAWRMKEAAEFLMPYGESPRTRTWFELLRHLSSRADYDSTDFLPGGSPI